MASSLVFTTIPANVVRPSTAHADVRGPRRIASPPPRAARSNWWSPLFGWSSEPDYIDNVHKPSEGNKAEAMMGERAVAEERRRLGKAAPRRFALFTEEKAREMRKRTMETEAFHNAMYHSSIASRLASDLPRPPPAATTTDL